MPWRIWRLRRKKYGYQVIFERLSPEPDFRKEIYQASAHLVKGGEAALCQSPLWYPADSACELSEEMRQRYAIQVASRSIHQDGKVFRDGIDITPDDIYATYDEKGVLPTTSAIPPEEYREFFAQYTSQGFAVLHIGLSSGISSTCQDAMIAAVGAGGRVCGRSPRP